jgi:hypothetical protein
MNTNGIKADLEERLDAAIRARCWRTARARARDIAKYEQEHPKGVERPKKAQ